MLKLHRLDIAGFKSFPDAVSLGFAGGINAIVGPNGCGKSNLSEAMTWVLGEQSAKSLRGGKMEDIIFNGSERRRALGMADATLILETDPSFEAAEDGKISIGRRVFRGGESQYRLNGKVVRLKEIKDLLMDTGLGIRAYSVIEQGKIGLILSGKPQERRKLLEEAAGITRYKQRKRIAELKLEEATANLLRLDDIVSEVERSLRSLKRQAGAARRYKVKQEEYRELLEAVLQGRWAALHKRLQVVEKSIAEAAGADAGAAAELSRTEADLATGREELDRLAAEVAEIHHRRAELAATIEGRQELIKGNRRTLQEIGERAARGRALAGRRGVEIVGFTETLGQLAGRRDEVSSLVEEASSEFSRRQREINAAEERLSAAKKRVETLRSQLLARVAEVNGLRNRRHQGEIDLEKGSYRRSHLEEKIAGVDRDVTEAAERSTAARDRVTELESRETETSRAIEKISADLEATLKAEAKAAEERRAVEEHLSESRQRFRLLSELGRAHAERRCRLEEALTATGITRPRFLSDRLSALEGWERGLDFFLGDLSDAVLVESGAAALEVARSLGREPEGPSEGQGLGARLLRPIEGADEIRRVEAALPSPDDPAIALSLGEALGLSRELSFALPPAYLVEEPADAERLARRWPGVAFLCREGLWAAGGALHLEAAEATPGSLERESEIAELEEGIPAIESELAKAVAEVEGRVAERAALAKESHRLEGERSQLRQDLAVARARLEDISHRGASLAETRSELAGELATLLAGLERRDSDQQNLDAQVRDAEDGHAELQESFDRAQEEAEEARSFREGLKTSGADHRGRLELLRERQTSCQREIERLEGALAEGSRLNEEWEGETRSLDHRRKELEESLEAAERKLQSALEGRSAVDEDLLAAQERLDTHRAALRTLEATLAGRRERREVARTRLEGLRVDRAGANQDAEHLAATIREELGREPAAEPGEPPEDLDRLENDLAVTKATLERLGPVNLLAVEELEEQEERHAFLIEQRADIVASVESLRTTIREINETSSERFLETFTAVNTAFGEVFTRLFRGGEAKMRLMDEEDVLETGIEILARPPGKRLQNIMLLSGGEKALTAIALLFALFRTKPSPFCILDEVDAPLDDVNTVRFVELLKEMSRETQFIIVTHNKITMEQASVLYGVTMEERGVSKLVSVELEDLHPLEEPQAKTA